MHLLVFFAQCSINDGGMIFKLFACANSVDTNQATGIGANRWQPLFCRVD
jgi:hypothetical protein